MIGIPVGLLFANASEWLVHKHLLHNRGKKRASFWSFHFHEHHSNCRRNNHIDEDYQKSPFLWNAQGKEALTLTLATMLYLPLLPVAPFFTLTVVYSSIHYYRVHKRSHLDPDWAREHLPWHYDHHMGPNQDSNWCVTRPWFDTIMGTREPYVGTAREEKDRARRLARLAKAAATPPAG